ncbi:methyltransferase domain-containing protein [Streptomyces collinus]|uniref:class I SAM-dependent methyltransferase n=1 Tax=Streptomyces collinus TaxID=42684 RepID=UPI0036E44452
MFTPEGPTLRELAVQAMSSVEHGYDLLAPKFDHTPFRTSGRLLGTVAEALRPLGPFRDGLDLCCGTGAGTDVLTRLCRRSVTGLDFSAGMLDVARRNPPAAGPGVAWVRGDARALPFAAAFDLVVSFGAFGHFLPRELPGLFGQVHSVLRPGGRFAFPVLAPPRPTGLGYWTLLGFDTVMRVRNALWRPLTELGRAGFEPELRTLPEFGRRADGSPRARVVLARRTAGEAAWDGPGQPAAGSVNS